MTGPQDSGISWAGVTKYLIEIPRITQQRAANLSNVMTYDMMQLTVPLTYQYAYAPMDAKEQVLKQFITLENYEAFLEWRIENVVLTSCSVFNSTDFNDNLQRIESQTLLLLQTELGNTTKALTGVAILAVNFGQVLFPPEFTALRTQQQVAMSHQQLALNSRENALTQAKTILAQSEQYAHVVETLANNSARTILTQGNATASALLLDAQQTIDWLLESLLNERVDL